VKINGRLRKIALVAFALAIVVNIFIYKSMKKAALPEETETIAYFKYNMEKNSIIEDDSSIEFRATPKSLVPKTAVRNLEEIKGKRLVMKADKGDFVLTNKLIERGDVRVDVTKLWTIGLDVKNISNFLGGNLREGGEYLLLYKKMDNEKYLIGEPEIVSKIMVVNMVDSTGRVITENGENVVKTINISVDNKETMLRIAIGKEEGKFEIIDAPKNYRIVKNSEKQETDMKDIEINYSE
jgi:hypothetical protein